MLHLPYIINHVYNVHGIKWLIRRSLKFCITIIINSLQRRNIRYNVYIPNIPSLKCIIYTYNVNVVHGEFV